MLRNFIAVDDRNSSHSDCSSFEDNEREKVKGQTVKKASLRKKLSESPREEAQRD
jgi:hypothetical protein